MRRSVTQSAFIGRVCQLQGERRSLRHLSFQIAYVWTRNRHTPDVGRGTRPRFCLIMRARYQGSTWAYRKARAQILRCGTVCAICGGPPRPNDPFVTDPIWARALGGGDHAANLQAVHSSCTARKGAGPQRKCSHHHNHHDHGDRDRRASGPRRRTSQAHLLPAARRSVGQWLRRLGQRTRLDPRHAPRPSALATRRPSRARTRPRARTRTRRGRTRRRWVDVRAWPVEKTSVVLTNLVPRAR